MAAAAAAAANGFTEEEEEKVLSTQNFVSARRTTVKHKKSFHCDIWTT